MTAEAKAGTNISLEPVLGLSTSLSSRRSRSRNSGRITARIGASFLWIGRTPLPTNSAQCLIAHNGRAENSKNRGTERCESTRDRSWDATPKSGVWTGGLLPIVARVGPHPAGAAEVGDSRVGANACACKGDDALALEDLPSDRLDVLLAALFLVCHGAATLRSLRKSTSRRLEAPPEQSRSTPSTLAMVLTGHA